MIVNFSDAPEVTYWNGIGSGREGIWVDKLSRKLFPLIYTLFNLLYWIICCTSGHMPYPSNVIRHPIELIEGWRSFLIMCMPIYESYLIWFSCALLISDLNIVYLCPMYILTILILYILYCHTVVEKKIKDSLHIWSMLFIFKHPLNKNGIRLGTMFQNDHLNENKSRLFPNIKL